MTRQFIWNQDLQSQAREVLLGHSEELLSCFQKTLSESQSSIDESIDLFTSRLTDLMRPCFEISKVTPKVGQVSKIPRVHSGVIKWINPDSMKNLKLKTIHNCFLCPYKWQISMLCFTALRGLKAYKNMEHL